MLFDDSMDAIEAGQKSGMKVFRGFQVVYGGYRKPSTFSIDIDGKGSEEITIVSSEVGSVGSGTNSIATVKSQSGLMFLGEEKELPIVLISDTIIDQINSRTNVYYNSLFKCIDTTNSGQSDSIYNTGIVPYLREGQIISVTDEFIGARIQLNKKSSPLDCKTISSNSDTSVYKCTIEDFNCIDYPDNEEFYLGFILDNKLGWIKLVRQHTKVFYLGHAIQR